MKVAIAAMKWVLEDAPVLPAQCFAVLMVLADKADESGCAAYPSQKTLAKRARKSERSVRNDLATLEDLKLIRRGDQSLVAHFPADRRPVVWDLAIELKADQDGLGIDQDGRKQASPRNSASPRKDTAGGNSNSGPSELQKQATAGSRLPPGSRVPGGSTVQNGRKPASDNPSSNPSLSHPSDERTPPRAGATLLGVTLLNEHMKAYRHKPPRAVLESTGRVIDGLVDEGISAEDIRAGLALLRARPHLGSGLLPSLVHEAQQGPPPQLRAVSNGKYAPGSGSEVPDRDSYDVENLI
jgi:hypothetical protein